MRCARRDGRHRHISASPLGSRRMACTWERSRRNERLEASYHFFIADTHSRTWNPAARTTRLLSDGLPHSGHRCESVNLAHSARAHFVHVHVRRLLFERCTWKKATPCNSPIWHALEDQALTSFVRGLPPGCHIVNQEWRCERGTISNLNIHEHTACTKRKLPKDQRTVVNVCRVQDAARWRAAPEPSAGLSIRKIQAAFSSVPVEIATNDSVQWRMLWTTGASFTTHVS